MDGTAEGVTLSAVKDSPFERAEGVDKWLGQLSPTIQVLAAITVDI